MNAVNFNQYDEIFVNEISELTSMTKFPTTKFPRSKKESDLHGRETWDEKFEDFRSCFVVELCGCSCPPKCFKIGTKFASQIG